MYQKLNLTKKQEIMYSGFIGFRLRNYWEKTDHLEGLAMEFDAGSWAHSLMQAITGVIVNDADKKPIGEKRFRRINSNLSK